LLNSIHFLQEQNNADISFYFTLDWTHNYFLSTHRFYYIQLENNNKVQYRYEWWWEKRF
jgi:hypothetical protein